MDQSRGGRAGEFCMGLAQALGGQAHVWALAADTAAHSADTAGAEGLDRGGSKASTTANSANADAVAQR